MNDSNGADGDALRRVAKHADMSRPMDIDFAVVVPTEAAGKIVGARAVQRGYAVELEENAGGWTCYCTKRMLATHEAVVAAQAELEALAASEGGYADGWGTLGNR
jgi:hypothetical protein